MSVCEMHREWLGGMYDWAGRYRTLELEKAGFRWPPAYLVAENMRKFEVGLLARHTPCRGDSIVEVSRRLAQVHAELLLIHPFRDGNGRLARWLADLMAAQAGYSPPVYGFAGRGASGRRAAYLEGVRRGYVEETEGLIRFFTEALRRADVDRT